MIDDNACPIPGLNLRNKDIEDLRTIDRNNIRYYYLTLVSRGVICKTCGKLITTIKDYKLRKINYSSNVVIMYKARRYYCKACNKSEVEENIFSKDSSKISDYAVSYILKELKKYNSTFSECANDLDISVTKVVEVFDSYVQMPRLELRKVLHVDEFYFSRHSKR